MMRLPLCFTSHERRSALGPRPLSVRPPLCIKGRTGDPPVPSGNLPDRTSLKGWRGPAQGKRNAALGHRVRTTTALKEREEPPALCQSAFALRRKTQVGARPARWLGWFTFGPSVRSIRLRLRFRKSHAYCIPMRLAFTSVSGSYFSLASVSLACAANGAGKSKAKACCKDWTLSLVALS